MSDLDVEPVDSVDEESTDGTDETGGQPPGTHAHTDPATTAATTDLPAGVDAPEYVLYGGKGGVGKTTMAAATALASAAGGDRTLVVSTDPAHSLSDTFETELPPTPTRIRDEIPLFAAEIDPEAAMDESVLGAFDGRGPETDGADATGTDAGAPFAGGSDGSGGFADGPDGFPGMGLGGDDGMGGVGEMLGGGLLGGAGAMPGADEAAAMQQLLAYLDDPRFDRVVVDTAPTGHTLRLLQLPEFLDTMVGRLVRMREQFGGLMDRVTGLFGDDEPAASPDLDELSERIERLRAVLQDPDRTDFRVVMVPEEMSVVESERLISRLGEFEIPVSTVVVNRVMEGLDDVATVAGTDDDAGRGDAGPTVDPEWVVTPNLEDCAFCQRRWQVQQRALTRASELFRGRRVERVPLLADEVRGEAALRVVAACLA
jgi:arsenite-transporting ATPase